MHSVFKYMPNGAKSSFATELKYPLGLCFDREGNLFVSDGAAIDHKSRRSILKFAPDGKRSVFVTGISSVGMAFDRSANSLFLKVIPFSNSHPKERRARSFPDLVIPSTSPLT